MGKYDKDFGVNPKNNQWEYLGPNKKKGTSKKHEMAKKMGSPIEKYMEKRAKARKEGKHIFYKDGPK